VLEAFWAYQLSDEVQRRYSIGPLTRADKVKMLGENYAGLIGLDIAAAQDRIADDQFAQELAKVGLAPPYSHWRERMGAAPASVGR
jgi:hypothetical protein